VVAFRRRIALYWPTKCVFRLSAANGESTPKNRADCTVQGRVGANQRLDAFALEAFFYWWSEHLDNKKSV
jgi:hypothetical protein